PTSRSDGKSHFISVCSGLFFASAVQEVVVSNSNIVPVRGLLLMFCSIQPISMASSSQAVVHNIEPPWIGMLSVTKDTSAKHTGTLRKAAKSGFPFTLEQKESVAAMCWPCHCIVHRLIPADILAASFHSINLLRTHGGPAWLRWAQQKSIMLRKPRQREDPPCLEEVSENSKRLGHHLAENQGGFPRWEGKVNKTRGHALRQQVDVSSDRVTLGSGHRGSDEDEAGVAGVAPYFAYTSICTLLLEVHHIMGLVHRESLDINPPHRVNDCHNFWGCRIVIQDEVLFVEVGRILIFRGE
ncbi:hypothetical protein B0H14DRAFT_3695517, partial [Mycena olivaceomarginata]